MRAFSFSGLATLTLACAVVGCDGDDGGGGAGVCTLGTEGCGCREDGTCDDGLVCEDPFCVAAGTGGSGTGGGTPDGAGAGGTSGQGGTPGQGGSTGGTSGSGGSNVPIPDSVGPQPLGPAAKVDLLLSIDNSISMADKQEILELAIPQLVGRLIDPACVDSTTGAVTAASSAAGCPSGSEAEFAAVQSIHVGVITSSLGSQGGTLCSPEFGPTYWNETQNDRGRLISRDRDGDPVPTWSNGGFLAWDPAGTAHDPSGESDATALIANFRSLVTGAGEQGCGYEATLEAWYRFLIDPAPPMDVVYDSSVGMTVAQGVDDILLAQRRLFLRPDSVVAIVMLTDENDCSIVGSGVGWMVGDSSEGTMPRSTSVCDSNPNDPCCMSCIQANWPAGCNDPAADSKCQLGLMHGDVDRSEDRLNLRCFDQKRRFGIDLLYPIERYADGLTSRQVQGREGQMEPNPLYANSTVYPGATPRADSSRIFLAGIVGVPWQDIATDASLSDSTAIAYLSADQITARGIWDDIVGSPDASPPVSPNDPFMIESSAPRTGTNPRTGVSISSPSSGPGGNEINGYEVLIDDNMDLQYACIFPLGTARDCSGVPPGVGCDCKMPAPSGPERPLCDGYLQVYAKAYPGSRILRVLQDYGTNSVVASICPKNPSCADMTEPHCGYNPAVSALLQRMRTAL